MRHVLFSSVQSPVDREKSEVVYNHWSAVARSISIKYTKDTYSFSNECKIPFVDLHNIEVSKREISRVIDYIKLIIKNKNSGLKISYASLGNNTANAFYYNIAEFIYSFYPNGALVSVGKFKQEYRRKETQLAYGDCIKQFKFYSRHCAQIHCMYSPYGRQEEVDSYVICSANIEDKKESFDAIYSANMILASVVLGNALSLDRQAKAAGMTQNELLQAQGEEKMPFTFSDDNTISFLEDRDYPVEELIKEVKYLLSYIEGMSPNPDKNIIQIAEKKYLFNGEKKCLGDILHCNIIDQLNRFLLQKDGIENVVKLITFLKKVDWLKECFADDQRCVRNSYAGHLNALLEIGGRNIKHFNVEIYCNSLVARKEKGYEITEAFLVALVEHVSKKISVGVLRKLIAYSMRQCPANKSFITKLVARQSWDVDRAQELKGQKQLEVEQEKVRQEKLEVRQYELDAQQTKAKEEKLAEERVKAAERRVLKAKLDMQSSSDDDSPSNEDQKEKIIWRNIFDEEVVWQVNGKEVEASNPNVYKVGFASSIAFKAYMELPGNMRGLIPSGMIQGKFIKLASAAQGDTGVKFNAPEPYVAEIKFLGSQGDTRIYFTKRTSSKDHGDLYTGAVVGAH